MKALATAALLSLVVACGQGRAIFIVNVLTFMQPSGRDTVRYALPPSPITVTADSFIPAQKISLPSGLGSSSVDSVSVTAAAVVDNATGTGSVTFDVFFAKDSASAYSGTPYFTATGTISGTQPSTVPLVAPTTVSLSDSVFNTNTLWVGVHARLNQNAGPGLTGKVRLTTVTMRIVLQDKVF